MVISFWVQVAQKGMFISSITCLSLKNNEGGENVEQYENITQEEFKKILSCKTGDRGYKIKTWSNYPNSYFCYYADDDKMRNEIAIITDMGLKTKFSIMI